MPRGLSKRRLAGLRACSQLGGRRAKRRRRSGRLRFERRGQDP